MTEVLVTGTFNTIHPDHIRLLEFAARWGSVTVGINADPYLQEKYGEHAVPLVDRAYLLRSVCFVNDVVVFAEQDPSKLIRRLRPKYVVKGPDYRDVELPESWAIKEVGAQLIIRPGDREYSSTEIVKNKGLFSDIDI